MKKIRLEDKFFLIDPSSNGVGRFIPFCNYERHMGVVKDGKHSRCEKKNCEYYLRLYIVYRTMKGGNEDVTSH